MEPLASDNMSFLVEPLSATLYLLEGHFQVRWRWDINCGSRGLPRYLPFRQGKEARYDCAVFSSVGFVCGSVFLSQFT